MIELDVKEQFLTILKNVSLDFNMVGAERFELPTLWSQTRCATRLRYAPKHKTSITT